MKALLVSVNGKRIALAGVGGEGVVTLMVVLASHEVHNRIDMEIGGVISETGHQVIWPSPEIDVGDEIHVKFVEVDSADEPMD